MDIFIVPIKSDDVYVDITEHTEKIVDASKYKDDRPLHTGKSLKQKSDRDDERWIRWKKQWKKLLPLRPKMYRYLTHDDHVDKKEEWHREVFYQTRNKIPESVWRKLQRVSRE